MKQRTYEKQNYSWVSFNKHKYSKNHYNFIYFFFLFKTFQKSEFNLQKNYDSWKNVYMKQKNDIEKKKSIILIHLTNMILNGTI